VDRRSERQGVACQRGSTTAACERTRHRAVEAVKQSMEAERLRRHCDCERDVAKALRQRLEAPGRPSSDTLTCVAATP
jgi:hypothetical protein